MDVRKQFSLLLANGHSDAGAYPVGRIWEEAAIVVARQSGELASAAALMQMAIASGMGSKEAAKHFTKLIEDMTRDGGQG